MVNNCPICRESIGTHASYMTSCNHLFHDSCIQQWKHYQSRSRRTCPICRKKLSRKPLEELTMTYSIITLLIGYTLIFVFLQFIKVREEINDNGACQFNAQLWCTAQGGYTWYKSEPNGVILCNIDYCYRNSYFGFYF